ncbi:MAG: hypothetical protein R2745_11690 [Vicinamibacterales bacterium]
MRKMSTTVAVCLLVLAGAVAVSAQSAYDDFEFWVPTEQNGTARLSSDESHSGLQSLKLSSTPGGQRYIYLTHVFPQGTRGTMSVWFYDTAPGQQTLYSSITAYNTATSEAFQVGVADWSGSNYVWYGPGLGQTQSSVARSLGWHQFVLRIIPTGYEALVDNVVVGTVAGDYTFDGVQLIVSGPDWRPDASYYFDDFSFVEYIPGPQVPIPAPLTTPRPPGGNRPPE